MDVSDITENQGNFIATRSIQQTGHSDITPQYNNTHLLRCGINKLDVQVLILTNTYRKQ